MFTTTYLTAVQGVLKHLETTASESIGRAVDVVATAMTGGGVIYCSEIGHGLQGDFINRAGGLVAVQPFSYSLSVTNPRPPCRRGAAGDGPDDRDLERVRAAVNASALRRGDVMFVSSVSGRNRPPIELALQCRERGIVTIGFTAFAYTERVESLHPSGKRLREAVDVAIDIGAPYGDAAVPIEGHSHPSVPLSGVGQVVAGWLIWGGVMERLATAGTPASVLISHNRSGGPEYNETSRAAYDRRGF
jgi:uncharacterized phosphosugar-binding protein